MFRIKFDFSPIVIQLSPALESYVMGKIDDLNAKLDAANTALDNESAEGQAKEAEVAALKAEVEALKQQIDSGLTAEQADAVGARIGELEGKIKSIINPTGETIVDDGLATDEPTTTEDMPDGGQPEMLQ